MRIEKNITISTFTNYLFVIKTANIRIYKTNCF